MVKPVPQGKPTPRPGVNKARGPLPAQCPFLGGAKSYILAKKQHRVPVLTDGLSSGSQLEMGGQDYTKEGQTPLSVPLPIAFSAPEKTKEAAVGLWRRRPDLKGLLREIAGGTWPDNFALTLIELVKLGTRKCLIFIFLVTVSDSYASLLGLTENRSLCS